MPSFAPTNPTQNQSEAQPAPQEPMVAQNGIETAQPVCSPLAFPFDFPSQLWYRVAPSRFVAFIEMLLMTFAEQKAQAPMEMSLRGGEYAGCNCCGCGCSESCC